MTASEQARAEASHPCSACGGSGRAENVRGLWLTCPVCQGSGRISDRMPVADALADAETLRVEAARYPTGYGYDLEGAEAWVDWTAPYLAWYDARNAAHAAFNAIPGLRGGR